MDSKEIVRQRVLSLIDSYEESDISFESRMNLRFHTVAEWRQGKGKTYMNYLSEIADEYGVSIDWLFGRRDKDAPKVPVIGRIQAGYPIESYEGNFGSIILPNDVSPNADVFALEIVGDSMMPIFMERDIIICEKIHNNYNGKFCVITIDGESTLKKLKVDSSGVTLVPLNPLYKEIHYTKQEITEKDIRVDGAVIESIRKF